MYRTATLSVFDVLDTIFVNAVVTEYNGTPGLVEPTKSVVSVSVRSTGDDDWRIWLWRALQQLQSELDQE
jgi:hypothetical protein